MPAIILSVYALEEELKAVTLKSGLIIDGIIFGKSPAKEPPKSETKNKKERANAERYFLFMAACFINIKNKTEKELKRNHKIAA